ncbi:MAG: response regulator transcription factor [Ruminococcaceae bacterium]|nr:response regulator transcription factor [Oscillospiraceae bacterium]
MRIAICDDNSAELEWLSQCLDAYRVENSTSLHYHTFRSGGELCTDYHCGAYDLVFLDILMPHMNGIETARNIRRIDADVKLVFLTSSPEFALDGYSVKARDYILKPVLRERVFQLLDDIISESVNVPECFSIKTPTGLIRIPYDKLCFVEVLQKKLHFHMADGIVRIINAPLNEYEAFLLSRPEFIKVHRSYIVNLDQVSELTSSDFVTYSGHQIPVSRLLYQDVRKAYMEYLFEGIGG